MLARAAEGGCRYVKSHAEIMKRSLAAACCLISAVTMATARDLAPSAKASSITGTVIQEPGSRPLKKVVVQVMAEDQKRGGNYTATTDSDGRFHVESVIPARYRIFFEKTGFVEVNGRGLKADVDVFTIQSGQALDDLLFRMLPAAIISGRITDEDGDPMPGVRVVAQRKRPGKSGREAAGTEATIDLGEYRLAGLFPGQYWVVAMPPPDFRDYEPRHQKSQPDAAPAETRYLTTYYPGTFDATQASPVALKAGDEMPVNFTLVPARTYRVRGIVTGITPTQKSVVELMSKIGDAFHANANDIGPDGQFEVRGVGPGTYLLRVSAGSETAQLSAHQDVSVVAADVDGLKLTPLPSFTLSGRLRIEGRFDNSSPSNLTQYSANLRLADSLDDADVFVPQDFFGMNASVDHSGNFEWKNVNPGNYIVQVYGGGAQNTFLQSATLGGRDIETGFTATGPATLDLVVSGKGGTIEGTVVGKGKDVDIDNSHLVANATVVAVPEEKYRKLPDHFVTGATDQRGAFTIHGVPPGSYTLYAWQDLEDGLWRDADFLKSQEATGTAVKVEEASDQRFDLKLSTVSEDWR